MKTHFYAFFYWEKFPVRKVNSRKSDHSGSSEKIRLTRNPTYEKLEVRFFWLPRHQDFYKLPFVTCESVISTISFVRALQDCLSYK